MAKQTFTTGQVLTSAQMTNLQQTAMLGGAASAKTASYTLVAADAGTAITMSNASATTITVNTALFAAGDTVQITNIGAGVCTITAGTATVNTSSSLALAQYEGGTLIFTSTSASIFIKGDGAAASAGALTLITTATAANTAVTLSVDNCFSTTYEDYFILIDLKASSSSSASFKLRVSSTDSSTAYYSNGIDMSSASTTVTGKAQSNGTFFDLGDFGTNAGAKSLIVTNPFIAVDTGFLMTSAGGWQGTSTSQRTQQGIHQASTSYTSFSVIGQFNLTGTVRVYGYAK